MTEFTPKELERIPGMQPGFSLMGFWGVVCTQFHGVVGPFKTLREARDYAEELSVDDKDGCQYLPVRLQLMGKEFPLKDKGGNGEQTWGPTAYL